MTCFLAVPPVELRVDIKHSSWRCAWVFIHWSRNPTLHSQCQCLSDSGCFDLKSKTILADNGLENASYMMLMHISTALMPKHIVCSQDDNFCPLRSKFYTLCKFLADFRA